MSTDITDCWNTIGVHGDSSCGELRQVVHCRNCPVHARAAATLLDAEPPADYIEHWTEQARQAKDLGERAVVSVLIFRLGAEWLALPTAVLSEIASLRPVHSLPHRRSGVLLGIANIRGELLMCVALRDLLGVESAQDAAAANGVAATGRLLVVQRDGLRAVCPVDEVHGIERVHMRELGAVPATIAGADSTYTRSTLRWRDRTVGVLDEQRLFHAVSRGLE
jgi:chemotaxis-related protein WspD